MFFGRLDDAVVALKKVKDLKPDDKFLTGFISNGGLRAIYTRQGKYEEAIKINQEEIRSDPESPLSYFTLGDLYFTVGRYDEAIAAYKQGIGVKPKPGSLLPDFSGSYTGPQRLASLYVKMGRLEDAIEPCREAIQLNQKNEEAYRILADVYLKLGRNKDAIEISKQAVQAMPDNAETYYELGATFLATGDKKSALAQYKILLSKAENAKDKTDKNHFERYAKELLEKINK
jgi:tetratricopeptide (TPR) repeat protein